MVKVNLEVDWGALPRWVNYVTWDSSGEVSLFQVEPTCESQSINNRQIEKWSSTIGLYKRCDSAKIGILERPRKWKIDLVDSSTWKVFNDEGELAIFNNEETARRILAQWNGEEE